MPDPWDTPPPPPVSLPVMLLRGLAHRCPRCGSGGVFASWFRLVDRCPGCGYRFEREEGFWLGAYVINFVITEGLVLLCLVVYLVVVATHPGTSVVPALVAALGAAVLVPLGFYPSSRTLWAALDLTMRPMDPAEEADAAAAAAAEPQR